MDFAYRGEHYLHCLRHIHLHHRHCDHYFFDRIEMKVVKGKSREPRECFMLKDDRHVLPRGIYFIKRIQGEHKFISVLFCVALFTVAIAMVAIA